jgi:DNA replication ATP-dependent helicase Dna2
VASYKNLASSFGKKEPSNLNLSQMQSFTIPVELKSGKTTFSIEHEGQVMFYSLLNSEKRNSSLEDFGLLLYLKDMNMKFVNVNHTCLRGLIQLRNELVYYIFSNRLPEVKNESRICSNCPLLTVCSLLNTSSSPDLLSVYSSSISHLTADHRQFFRKWYNMLENEYKDYKQFESGPYIWWKSRAEMESTGLTVFDLKLVDANESNKENKSASSLDFSIDSFHLLKFKKLNSNSSGRMPISLKPNDMVLLSSQTSNHVGISQGFIKSIENDSFLLFLDKNLSGRFESSHLFRIDKINFRAAINLNYTNLSRLMSNGEVATRLRAFIVDKKVPVFEKLLVKETILKNKHIFKKLNQNQQSAIIKVHFYINLNF